MTIQKLKKLAPELAKTYSIKYLAVFGSFSRNEETEKSDVDLLVKFSKPVNFIDLLRTEKAIKKLLKRKIDLVTPDSLSPKIRKYVKKDLKVLYER